MSYTTLLPKWTLVTLLGRGVRSYQLIFGTPIETIKIEDKWPQWSDAIAKVVEKTRGVNHPVYAVFHNDLYNSVNSIHRINPDGTTVEIDSDQLRDIFVFSVHDVLESARLAEPI